MKKGIIIAGFAGIGKSTLAHKYDNIVDLEIMDYKWDYGFNIEKHNIEQLKGAQNKKRKSNWPHNYLNAIKDAIVEYDIVLISTDNEILEILDTYGIDYILCFPKINCRDEYLQRYRNRGNNEEFILRAKDTFEVLIKELNKSEKNKLILESNETLEKKLLKALNKKNEKNER